jgi:chromosome segregation ATPase
MTTVGKILVVLHLVLSIIFMAFAGAVFTAQKNWRNTALAHEKSLKASQTKLQNLQAEHDRDMAAAKTRDEKAADDIQKLTNDKSQLTTEVLTLTGENEKLQLANDKITDQAGLAAVEADERTAEAKIQRDRNAVAYKTRQELNEKLHDVEDKLFAKEQEMQVLIERHERVLKEMQTIKIWLGSKGLPTDPKAMVAQTTPPPPVEGLVVNYLKEKKGTTELVEVSLGSDDGLSVGHKMTVFNREGRYLGQIRLTLVNADSAVGIVTEKAKNIVIQKGDNVTTKL